MNENEMAQDDEISLFDLWEKLREGWHYVVGGRDRIGQSGVLGCDHATEVRGGGGCADCLCAAWASDANFQP